MCERKTRLRVFGWLGVLVAAGLSAGCGDDKGSVSGTVSYRGTPLPAGTVTFFGGDNEIVASAPVHDGKYAAEDVPVGPVKISVSVPPALRPDRRHPPPADMPGAATTPPVFIPLQYGNPAQSGLTYEVKSGAQDHPIDLN